MTASFLFGLGLLIVVFRRQLLPLLCEARNSRSKRIISMLLQCFTGVSSLRRRSKICSQNGRKGLYFKYAQIEDFEKSVSLVVLFSHSSTAAPCFIAVALCDRRTFEML